MEEKVNMYQIGIKVEGLGQVTATKVVHRTTVHQKIPHTPLHTRTRTDRQRLATSDNRRHQERLQYTSVEELSVTLESNTSCRLMGRQRACETLEARDATLRPLPNIKLW